MTEETVYKNKWFKVLKKGKWHYIVEKNSNNGAVILILEDNKNFLFVKNYRQAINSTLIELPRGYGNKNEQSINTAKREALEETGYQIDSLNIMKLGSIYPNSAILSSKIDIFFAQVTPLDKIQDSDSEVIEIVKLSHQEISKYINQNKIQDAFSLSALSMYYTKIYNTFSYDE